MYIQVTLSSFVRTFCPCLTFLSPFPRPFFDIALFCEISRMTSAMILKIDFTFSSTELLGWIIVSFASRNRLWIEGWYSCGPFHLHILSPPLSFKENMIPSSSPFFISSWRDSTTSPIFCEKFYRSRRDDCWLKSLNSPCLCWSHSQFLAQAGLPSQKVFDMAKLSVFSHHRHDFQCCNLA